MCGKQHIEGGREETEKEGESEGRVKEGRKREINVRKREVCKRS